MLPYWDGVDLIYGHPVSWIFRTFSSTDKQLRKFPTSFLPEGE